MILKQKKRRYFYFLAEVLFYTAISMLWYQSLLFRCLPNMTYEKSRSILWIMILVNILIGIWSYARKGEEKIAKMLIVPYGMYVALAYVNVFQTWIYIICLLVAAGSIACSIIVMTPKIGRRKNRKKIIFRRMERCMELLHTTLAAGMTVLMAPLVGMLVVNGSFVTTPADMSETHNSQNSKQETIESNMQELVCLQEKYWQTLSLQKKCEILQTVADIERDFWGIPHELHVSVVNLSAYTLGGYEEKSNTIYMDMSHLENDPASKSLEVILHECCHGFQYNLVEIYLNTPENVQRLKIYENAADYASEFCNYIDSSDSFEDYYNQKCETDARSYAQAAKEVYFEKINAYWNGEGNFADSDGEATKSDADTTLWDIYLRDRK